MPCLPIKATQRAFDDLPTDVLQKLAAACEEVMARKEQPIDVTVAIADILKPPSPSPIDTRTKEAFNADLAAKGIATMHLNLIGLGDELGLFKSLVSHPKSYQALAKDVGCNERYIKEWCICMLAGKVLEYDDTNGFFSVVKAIAGAVVPEMNTDGLIWCTLVPAGVGMRPKMAEAYKNGEGIDWNEYDSRLGAATCNFFKPLYENMLLSALPPEVTSILEDGGFLADIGCGQGVSTAILAKAFPKSTFKGFDYCGPSLVFARMNGSGLSNLSFEDVSAEKFGSAEQFDVTCFLDCFHDMAPAAEAAKRAAWATKSGGYCFLIEPMGAATDSVIEQVKLPTCTMFSAFSCTVCLCCSMCDNGNGLGALCPTSKHRELFIAAGFKSLEAIDNPVNEAGFRFLLAKK